MRTFSSREFNQDASRVKRAADQGPVFITDRGKPRHVLLSITDYERLAGRATSILEALAMDEGGDIAFDPPRLSEVARGADLS